MTVSRLAALGACTIGITALGVAAPAGAATIPGCGDEPVDGTITVSGGVCELTFTASGAYSWTLPTGVSGLYGLLVGAGGGAYATGVDQGYAGTAGSVRYVDYTAASAGDVISGVVGAGGNSSTTPTDGADTTSTLSAVLSVADGGAASTSNYCSIEGNFSVYVGVGDGAGGPVPLAAGGDCVDSYAPGINPSADLVDSYSTARPSIFASLNATFGLGGRVVGTTSTIASDAAIAGTGQGADVQFSNPPARILTFNSVGGSGRAVFRYAAVGGAVSPAAGPALAATGTDTTGALAGSATVIGLGALLLAVARRRGGRRTAA
jgi:hypothetical protein